MAQTDPNELEKIDHLRGTVKWFDLKKGFGFLVLENQHDAFLHISLLNEMGYYDIREGAIVECDVFYTDKGAQISKICEIIEGEGERIQKPDFQSEEVKGTVKWFKDNKGFGFVEPESGGEDIFVHRKILRKSGVPKIRSNQIVNVIVTSGDNGLEAEWISLAS